MVPRDENDAAEGPQVDEDHPKTGLEDGGVLVADADTDGGYCRPAAVVDEERGEHGGFQVFHVEWERVEVPYAIGLWIILTALVKVGKCADQLHLPVLVKIYVKELYL